MSYSTAYLPSRKWLEKELDKICSKIAKKKGFCVRCGSKDNLQDAHIIRRANHSVRWDLENRFCLCGKCHTWAHSNPILFDEFAKNILGEYRYEALYQRSLAIRVWEKHEMFSYLHVLRRQAGLVFSKEKTVEV